MLDEYKEIFFGFIFGLGAAILDTAIDAREGHHSLAAELGGHPGMLLYRLLFILFGFLVGWLMWQRNKRERDYRHLTESLNRFHEQCASQIVLLHAKLQILLTREELQLQPAAEELVRSSYERTQELQTLMRDKFPSI
jgi:H+/Cl- antiporter ClcA